MSILALTALTCLMQSAQGADTLMTLARTGSDSVLVSRARERPDDARTAFRQLFAAAAADTSTNPIAAAQRLARAYAVAWQDSFFVRQVARFTGWSPAQRREKVAADSLRLAGNDALGRAGVAVALVAWRASLARCTALDDSAGMAAALGNIGAGFYQADAPDSAETYLQRTRRLAAQIGDFRTAGNAVGLLAAAAADVGDLRRASELYALAAELRERTGDGRGAAADRNNLGLMAQNLGDWDGAGRAFEAALTLNRHAGRDEPAAANLVNLGNIARFEGDYAVAAARYGDALALYRAHGNQMDAADVLHNLGLLELGRGDYPAALARLSEALAIRLHTGPVLAVIAVRRDLAIVHATMGNLQGALIQLERAERLVDASGVPPELAADLLLSRADLAAQFNQVPEAERRYAEAGRLYRRIGNAAGQAAAQQGAGVLLLQREDYARAQAALELAAGAQEQAGDARGAALTRLLTSYAARQRGDTAGARRTLAGAVDTLRARGDPIGETAALVALGDLELQEGSTLAAESLYRAGVVRLGARPAPDVAWRVHAALGRALRDRGALAPAAAELGTAVAELERVSGSLSLEERRSAYLADKWDVYVDLALVERARGRSAAAFAASERLRAREMLDLLARGRLAFGRVGARNGALMAREQDLRRRISTLMLALEGGSAPGPRLRGAPLEGPGADQARQKLASVQEQYAQLLERMRDAQPDYARLVRGDIATPADIRSRLAPDEALVEYLVSESTTVAFVVRADTLVALDLNVGRHELATLVDFARGTLTRPDSAAAAAASWQAPLRRLYRYLIGPLETSGALTGVRALIIVPHVELHYLPFAALLGSARPGQYLVERYRLTYASSASVWLRLRQRQTAAVPSGVLALAPQAAALPGSAAEVAAVGRIFGERARTLVGADASESRFRALAPTAGIIHLATYGVLNKDNPLFSFVELAPQGEDDGRLEVHEVFGLTLGARLVVLSACQTALGAGALADVPAGDDWVGLVQAFLFAGAGNVVATLWPVEDRTTARFMEQFYTALEAGQPEAEALALAQRWALRNPGTAHPFYWAGFTLSGGRQ